MYLILEVFTSLSEAFDWCHILLVKVYFKFILKVYYQIKIKVLNGKRQKGEFLRIKINNNKNNHINPWDIIIINNLRFVKRTIYETLFGFWLSDVVLGCKERPIILVLLHFAAFLRISSASSVLFFIFNQRKDSGTHL